jgi:hypothetical protein
MSGAFLVSLAWLLAMTTAVLLADASVRRATSLGATAATAAATMLAASWLSPQPGWICILVAVICFWRVVAGISKPARLLSGVCVGLAAALHVGHGVSPWIAGLAAGGVLIAALVLAPPAFAVVRPWTLVTIALAAPAVGLAQAVAAGWRSAEALNQNAAEVASRPVPVWVMVWVGAALVAGALRGLWVRR